MSCAPIDSVMVVVKRPGRIATVGFNAGRADVAVMISLALLAASSERVLGDDSCAASVVSRTGGLIALSGEGELKGMMYAVDGMTA